MTADLLLVKIDLLVETLIVLLRVLALLLLLFQLRNFSYKVLAERFKRCSVPLVERSDISQLGLELAVLLGIRVRCAFYICGTFILFYL